MAAQLTECIRDGTFPESNDLLNTEATPESIASLLTSLTESRNQLRGELSDVSKHAASDVDGWIAQARKLQEDITRCKLEARQIVEQHERGEHLRIAVQDGANKVHLLESEIAFTKILEHEIRNISEVTQVLNEVESDLSEMSPVSAVGKLTSLKATIESVTAGQTRSLLTQLDNELRGKCQRQLEQAINSKWDVKKSESSITLTVHSETNSKQSSKPGIFQLQTDALLQALSDLQTLPSAISSISHTLDSFARFIISARPGSYPSSVEIEAAELTVLYKESRQDVHKILNVFQVVFQFWHTHIPGRIRNDIAHAIIPKLISDLIAKWLDLALPYELRDLQQLGPLRNTVSALAKQLEQYSWPGTEILDEWIAQIPHGWLKKRRIASLDGVRKAFSITQGGLRSVERVERQTIPVQTEDGAKVEEDWNTNWDDEPTASKERIDSVDEEDASGWDFETEDEAPATVAKQDMETKKDDEDDTGDAWGWGDDEIDAETSKQKKYMPPKYIKVNGKSASDPKVQEMVLTEIYHVTDIPDYILETIGKDLADSREVEGSGTKYFSTAPPPTGLSDLPNLTLALFRATAPTYYTLPSAKYTLSNLNLYNDTLYIIQKLKDTPDVTTLQPSIESLTRFARQIYSSELDTQRTIITDLLDGAQGFDRCTVFPNSQACIDAVSSTVDRLRQLHKEWITILGQSHLLQSLGSLLTTTFSKILKDIEDMDDISEAESKQLVTFCTQILSLEDLFGSPSQIMLYVPNYLRFQYLQQILDSSLVDIKYLWTEGELSLEFSADEVEDLMKALFAESQHRRNAIRDIRAGAVGGRVA